LTKIKIMTFNVENMLIRFDFNKYEQESLATLLDVDSDIEKSNLVRSHWNIINEENRISTALNMKLGNPDLICLQEVENMFSLKSFHDRYLRRISKLNYNYKALIEGNDPRGINVAMLSREKIDSIRTHQFIEKEIPYPEGKKLERVFRRDCLEVDIIKENKIITIYVCHFKSMSGGRNNTKPIREAEAKTVKEIIENRFDDPSNHDWIISGDLNDYTETDGIPDNNHSLFPLLNDKFSFNILQNIQDKTNRWTHFFMGDESYHQLDYILISPSLHDKNPNLLPSIIRNGQPFRAERYQGERWPRIGYERPKASDHSPVMAEISY
jgi:endonuclease/exonuclease/phosphatase family metal-dependent hydrolase